MPSACWWFFSLHSGPLGLSAVTYCKCGGWEDYFTYLLTYLQARRGEARGAVTEERGKGRGMIEEKWQKRVMSDEGEESSSMISFSFCTARLMRRRRKAWNPKVQGFAQLDFLPCGWVDLRHAFVCFMLMFMFFCLCHACGCALLAWVLFQHTYRGGWVEESITNKVKRVCICLGGVIIFL